MHWSHPSCPHRSGPAALRSRLSPGSSSQAPKFRLQSRSRGIRMWVQARRRPQGRSRGPTRPGSHRTQTASIAAMSSSQARPAPTHPPWIRLHPRRPDFRHGLGPRLTHRASISTPRIRGLEGASIGKDGVGPPCGPASCLPIMYIMSNQACRLARGKTQDRALVGRSSRNSGCGAVPDIQSACVFPLAQEHVARLDCGEHQRALDVVPLHRRGRG